MFCSISTIELVRSIRKNKLHPKQNPNTVVLFLLFTFHFCCWDFNFCLGATTQRKVKYLSLFRLMRVFCISSSSSPVIQLFRPYIWSISSRIIREELTLRSQRIQLHHPTLYTAVRCVYILLYFNISYMQFNMKNKVKGYKIK